MAYPAAKSVVGSGADRVLPREVFLHFLDLEVKRSRRYQNFFSVLVLTLDELPNRENGTGLQACCQRLTRLLAEEMRDSDILGALGEKRLAVILPYADLMAGGNTRSRFESSLQFYDFGRDGFRVLIEQVCFPRDGTDTSGLVRKVAGLKTLH
jgi:GGDEF domain-containing protein